MSELDKKVFVIDLSFEELVDNHFLACKRERETGIGPKEALRVLDEIYNRVKIWIKGMNKE